MVRRRTLRASVELRGRGLFTGAPASVKLRPGASGNGLTFVRVDLAGAPAIPALVDRVARDERMPGRNTSLRFDPARPGGPDNPSVATVEHVLSALAAMGVTDAVIELDGPEIPIFDGSGGPFVQAIAAAEIIALDGEIAPIRVDRKIRVEDPRGREHGTIIARPMERAGMVVSYTLDYGERAQIPAQKVSFSISPSEYASQIAPARTFCLEEEARQMKAAGLFKDLTPKDMLVLGPGGKPIENDLRYPDEAARHKVLDVVGDLALAGRPIEGHIFAERCGHALNHEMARRLESLSQA